MSKKNAFTTAALAALATASGMAAGVTAANAQTAAPPPPPPSVTTRWSGSPETREEDRRFHVSGRLQYDIYNVDAEFPGTSNDQSYTRTGVRRAFLGVDGRFTEQWRYNVKFAYAPGADAVSATSSDFCRDNVTGGLFPLASGASCATGFTKTTIVSAASGGADDLTLDDAYLEYAGENYSVFIGQNNALSPMEDRDSSLNIPFNERSGFINAFGFGKVVGVDFLTNGGNWSWGIGVHADDAGNPESAAKNEATYEITRGTWAPIYSRTPDGVTVLHLGLSARHRDTGQDGGLRYRARPAVGFNTRFVDTGSSTTFASDNFYGAEVAFQHNAFGVEAEYGTLEATAFGSGPDATFSGGYVDLFWSPTGESRNYNASDGSFGRITPLRTLGSDGGIGHVMLALRYDMLDLTDGTYDGGEQTSITGGVTWEPISYVKFQLNYTSSDIDRPSSLENGDVDTITLRTQFDW